MANISFNSSEVINAANKLRSRVEKMENALKRLDNACSSIETAWKGTDSQTYVSKVRQKRNEFSNVVTGFNNLASLLDKYAARMDQNKQDIIDAGSKL